MRKFKKILLLPLLLLCSCQKNNIYENKTFLHFKYKLESCADIKGQDPLSKIWFSDYHGDSYTNDFISSSCYLDMNVEMNNGKAIGKGKMYLLQTNGESIIENFDYYCTMNSTTGGYVVSSLNKDKYTTFVHCIYWVRLNMVYYSEKEQKNIDLTLHFRGGTSNPYPEEFDR